MCIFEIQNLDQMKKFLYILFPIQQIPRKINNANKTD